MVSCRNILKAGWVCTALFSLSACSFDTPSNLNLSSPIEVYQDSFRTQDMTEAFTPGVMSQISSHYRSHGHGPLFVTVAYDPKSKTNNAARARDDAKRLAAGLKAEGVRQVAADILPVEESGDQSQTIIAYGTLEAAAPADCPTVINRDFAEMSMSKDYRLGCSIETYMTRQIARPRDLLGNDVMDKGDGRRAHNVTDRYQSGEALPELKGEMASD